MNCSLCGTPSVRADQRFCARCGTELASGGGGAIPPADPTLHTPAAPEPAADTVVGGVPRTPVEPPPAYGQAPRVTGPLFADDVPPPPPVPPQFSPAPATFAVTPTPQPALASPPPPPVTYDDSRAGRRRTSIVLLGAAAVVAALSGAGGVVLLFADDDPTADASAEDRGNDKEAMTDAGATPSPDPAQSETESETTEPAMFHCWNGGAAVTRLAACPPPTGEAGLAWVFPSSTGATCAPKAGAQRESEAECAPVVSGAAVRFHYSEWRSRAALEAYYGGNTVAEIGAPLGRADLTAVQVESRDSSVGYKVAIYYTDPSALWSVTVYAADVEQYVAAISELDMRPFRQLRGERT